MAKKYNVLGRTKPMIPERKNIVKKVSMWLSGGGIIIVVTAAISFGVSKENIRSRLDKNDTDHGIIESKLDKNSEKVDVIDDRTARIETNVEWLMKTKDAVERIPSKKDDNKDTIASKKNK